MAEQPQPPAPVEAKIALEGALEIKKGIIRLDEKTVLNARQWKNGTLLTKEGRKTTTNLVDYLKEDGQIVTMLKEAARLGILKEADLAQMGISHKIYLSGEKADLKLYPLNHQQKAEALAFLLEKFSGDTLPKGQRELYFKRVFNEVVLKGVQHVDNEGGPLPIFSPRDVINCLIIAGHEENAEYLLQQGYRPSDRWERLDKSRRQVAAEVSTTPQPNYTRELEGKMKAVTKRGEKLNIPHTVDIDLRVAQAMFNVFLPAEDQIAMAKLHLEIDKTTDPTQKENLRKQLVDKRREAYAAILNAFETEGYQIGGQYLQEISQRSAQDRVIDRAREMNSDEGAIKRFKDKSIFEANRESLTLFASEILGVKEDKVRNAISKLDWSENKFEQLKNQLRQPGFSESHLNDLVYERLFEEFYDKVKPSPQRTDQPTTEDKNLLKLMFKERYLTERALRDRFKAVENPYNITLSEMQDWGIKGLDLLFRRTLPGYHEVEPYEDYVQRLRDRLKELAEQPPAPTPAEAVVTAPPAEAVSPLEQQLNVLGIKPDQLQKTERTIEGKKVTVYTLNQLTLPATEENTKALSQLAETLKNQGASFEIGSLTLNIPKDKAASAIDLGNCQLQTLKIEGEPAGKINIQNAKAATIELGNNLTARLEPADLLETPIEQIRLLAGSTLTIDEKHLPHLEKSGTKISIGKKAQIEVLGTINYILTAVPGEYKIIKPPDQQNFILEKAEAVVKPAEPPKPKTKAQQVKEAFKGAATGIKEAAQAKIDQYVQRIMAGANEQQILSGLPKGWRDEISKRLKEERGKQKAPIPPTPKPPPPPSAPTPPPTAAPYVTPAPQVAQVTEAPAVVKPPEALKTPPINSLSELITGLRELEDGKPMEFLADRFALQGIITEWIESINKKNKTQVKPGQKPRTIIFREGTHPEASIANQAADIKMNIDIKNTGNPLAPDINDLTIQARLTSSPLISTVITVGSLKVTPGPKTGFGGNKKASAVKSAMEKELAANPLNKALANKINEFGLALEVTRVELSFTENNELKITVLGKKKGAVTEAPAYTVVPPQPSTTVEPPPVTPTPKPSPPEPTVVEATVVPAAVEPPQTVTTVLLESLIKERGALAQKYGNIPAFLISDPDDRARLQQLESAIKAQQIVETTAPEKPPEVPDFLKRRQTATPPTIPTPPQEVEAPAAVTMVAPKVAEPVLQEPRPPTLEERIAIVEKAVVVPPASPPETKPPPMPQGLPSPQLPPSTPPPAEPAAAEAESPAEATAPDPYSLARLSLNIKDGNVAGKEDKIAATAWQIHNEKKIPIFIGTIYHLTLNLTANVRLFPDGKLYYDFGEADGRIYELTPKQIEHIYGVEKHLLNVPEARDKLASLGVLQAIQVKRKAEQAKVASAKTPPPPGPTVVEATVTPPAAETNLSINLSFAIRKLELTETQKETLSTSLPEIQKRHQLSGDEMSEILYQLATKSELIKNARPLTEQTLPPKPKEGKGLGRLRIGGDKDFEAKRQARETAEKELKEYNFIHDLIEQLIINKSPEEKGILAARFYRILQTMFPSFPADQSQLITLLLQEEHKEKQAAILEILQLI